MQSRSRRRFVKEVGFGMLAASVGPALVADMGLASMPRLDDDRLDFGTLEPLVALMQETPIHRFLPALKEKLQSGESLRTLVAAAALANARTFGGEDYIGFHTMMALAPAFRMSTQLPTERAALPVFKVLYRNTQRIHDFGGKDREVLKKIDLSSISGENDSCKANSTIASSGARSQCRAIGTLFCEACCSLFKFERRVVRDSELRRR